MPARWLIEVSAEITKSSSLIISDIYYSLNYSLSLFNSFNNYEREPYYLINIIFIN